MEYRLRVPRPQHEQSDPEEQEAWKKKLYQEVERVKNEHPDADVEVWCEDEHRVGRHPVPRRVWVEAGYQPPSKVNWKKEWLWLYAFVQPQNGETYWWILPYVNTDLFNQVLADFAQEFGVGKDKRIVLPLDQAKVACEQGFGGPRGDSFSANAALLPRITNRLSDCGH